MFEKQKMWIEKKSEEAKWKVQNGVEWCKNHKEMIVVFGPVIAGSLIEIVKISTKKKTVSEERALKERFIYDSHTRHYYETKRKPKNSEWLQIDQRIVNGELLGFILEDMGLLKK